MTPEPIGVLSTRVPGLPVRECDAEDYDEIDPPPPSKEALLESLLDESKKLLEEAWGPDWQDYL